MAAWVGHTRIFAESLIRGPDEKPPSHPWEISSFNAWPEIPLLGNGHWV